LSVKGAGSVDKEKIAGLLGKITGLGDLKVDEPMRLHTTFKIGGPADILVSPREEEELGCIVKTCIRESVPVFLMGNGSNLLVSDKGIRGVVVKLYDNFNKYEVRDDTITAQSGILLSRVSKIAWEYELTGLEFAEGIPGTLGGAVVMNAGAYTGEMKDVVVRTEYMDALGNIKVLVGEEHRFGYRSSFLQEEGGIVLKSEMKLKKGDAGAIQGAMNDYRAQRKQKQPLELPSAGSVFRRPPGYYVGPLIEGCLLKGYMLGGAQVSEKHCGFIVNRKNATAEDVKKLIQHIQKCVKEKYGVDLETEIRMVGEE
jgi:UDP-N-acetylmuramate dehydrogenase